MGPKTLATPPVLQGPVETMNTAWLLAGLLGCAPAWQRVLDEAVETATVPGAALTVLQGGDVIFEGTAGRDPSTDAPLRPSDRFRVGSLTKALTSVVLHQLHEDEVLSLSDPVVTWVPSAPVSPDATLDDLLRHVSGMGDYVDTIDYGEGSESFAVDALFALSGTPGTPRRALRYSNAGFVAAGLAIEAATGGSWEAAVRARILEPLDLSGGFPSEGTRPSGGTKGGQEATFHAHAENGRAASAWVATTGEVAHFAAALFDGELLEPDTLRRLRAQTVLLDGEVRTYGAGLDVGWDDEGRHHGHRGASPGYNAMWRHHVAEDLTLVAAINTSDAKAEQLVFSALEEARGR